MSPQDEAPLDNRQRDRASGAHIGAGRRDPLAPGRAARADHDGGHHHLRVCSSKAVISPASGRPPAVLLFPAPASVAEPAQRLQTSTVFAWDVGELQESGLLMAAHAGRAAQEQDAERAEALWASIVVADRPSVTASAPAAVPAMREAAPGVAQPASAPQSFSVVIGSPARVAQQKAPRALALSAKPPAAADCAHD